MRILVISNLFPPVVRGGFEVECAAVVEHLSRSHEVLVLSSDLEISSAGPPAPGVRRELSFLTDDSRGALRAPLAALSSARTASGALSFEPELVYCWNASNLPQAAVRLLADRHLPFAFRVCDHSYGDLFTKDQFMRELLPAKRAPGRLLWSAGCRAVNGLPQLRLDPLLPLRAAISWNSEFIRATTSPPPFVEPVLERLLHPVPPHAGVYEAVVRNPAPEPEIAFLGRVTPYKGVDVAIRALALLREERGIAARLQVIGPEDGSHGAELRALAGSLGVGGAVEWAGQQSPEEAAGRLARAHVLIVPSVWDEPFGLVPIEGALAGVPVVAADVGGIGEGLHDEEHALLYDASDASAAAAALARTLLEPEATAARVQRAGARAREFRLDSYLEKQGRFVEDALAALA